MSLDKMLLEMHSSTCEMWVETAFSLSELRAADEAQGQSSWVRFNLFLLYQDIP